MPTETNSVEKAEVAPTEGKVIPFPTRVLQTAEEVRKVIKEIENGKQARSKDDVLHFENFLKNFADEKGCIEIDMNGEKKAIPISEFSGANLDIQATLSKAIAANDNEPETLEATEIVAGKQTPTSGTVEGSTPLVETVAKEKEVSLNSSRQTETALPISETATPEENERIFAQMLKEVSTPQALVEAIRNAPGGKIRLRSKHDISGEQIAQNISVEGDDRILTLASNVNHADIQNAASRLMYAAQSTQEQTADVSLQLPENVSNGKSVPDNTPTPDTAIKNSDADASEGIIKEAPPAAQQEGTTETEDGINYFEQYFKTTNSMNDLKNYIRNMGETSKDGVLELKDTYGTTRVQFSSLLGAISRFNLGEGLLQEIPGENIRAAVERLSKKQTIPEGFKKAA